MAKHFLILLACIILQDSSTPVFAQNTDIKTNIKNFYSDFANNMTQSKYDDVISLVSKYFASDFGHFDDGTLAYGKEQFIVSLKEQKAAQTKMSVTIDFKSDPIVSADGKEVRINFEISQLIGPQKENSFSTKSFCHDSLRILNTNTFELYKCDCKTILGNSENKK